jgi:gliding motility-associated protein GldL
MSGSYKKKKFMNMITGFGAAIVIVGAMFKIQHWPGATIALIGGLSVEAVLFILGAFEAPHMEVDWSLVYPELAISHDEEHGDEELDEVEAEIDGSTEMVLSEEDGDAVAQKLDQMLMDANIGGDLIESLGEGLRNFGETAQSLNSVGTASEATESLFSSIENASQSVDKMSDAYSQASDSLSGMANLKGESDSYAEQLVTMTKNLGELNSVYEGQIEASNGSMKISSDIQQNINELLVSLSDSVEDTKKYKTEVATLGENLSRLNTVYGNMLSAMTLPGNQS